MAADAMPKRVDNGTSAVRDAMKPMVGCVMDNMEGTNPFEAVSPFYTQQAHIHLSSVSAGEGEGEKSNVMGGTPALRLYTRGCPQLPDRWLESVDII